MNFDVYHAPNGKIHILRFNPLSYAIEVGLIAMFGRA